MPKPKNLTVHYYWIDHTGDTKVRKLNHKKNKHSAYGNNVGAIFVFT